MEPPATSSTAAGEPRPHDSPSSHFSSSSSASSSAETHPPVPKDPPKIPPPPSEHPPPYTPFGGQNASLLPGTAQQPQRQARNNRRVVEPPGLRKYLRFLTARNVLIGLAILVAVCFFLYLLHRSNRADQELAIGKALEEHHQPLAIAHKGLGAVKGNKDRISFDEASNAVILSEFDPGRRLLLSDSVRLDDHLEGFQQTTFNVSLLDGQGQRLEFEDCMRFTARLVCCSTSGQSQSHQHLTKCLLQQPGSESVTSVASMFDFLPRWQSLVDDEQLLVVHNRQKQALLDVRRNVLLEIEEDRLPHGFISHGFFFDQDTANDLVELVRVGDEFRICGYVRSHEPDERRGYVLQDRNCRGTLFKVEFELPRTEFCANSLYTAIVQFGHLQGEATMLTWRLRVQFSSSSQTIYSTGDSVHAKQELIALDCDDENLNLFILGDHELHQFRIQLPKERNGHFMQKQD